MEIASIALPHAMSMETFLNLWDDMETEFRIRFGTPFDHLILAISMI